MGHFTSPLRCSSHVTEAWTPLQGNIGTKNTLLSALPARRLPLLCICCSILLQELAGLCQGEHLGKVAAQEGEVGKHVEHAWVQGVAVVGLAQQLHPSTQAAAQHSKLSTISSDCEHCLQPRHLDMCLARMRPGRPHGFAGRGIGRVHEMQLE